MPPSLHAMVQSEIDQLPPAASMVLGFQFDTACLLGMVDAAVEGDEETPGQRLQGQDSEHLIKRVARYEHTSSTEAAVSWKGCCRHPLRSARAYSGRAQLAGGGGGGGRKSRSAQLPCDQRISGAGTHFSRGHDRCALGLGWYVIGRWPVPHTCVLASRKWDSERERERERERAREPRFNHQVKNAWRNQGQR